LSHYPVLYSFRRCPYAMRARMALHYAGIQCEIREVDLKQKPPQLLEISPKGTVPVLQLSDGRIIVESLDIMLWALDQSDPAGWLRADKVTMRRLIHQNDHDFKHHLDRYKYPQRYADQEGAIPDGDSHFRLACDVLNGLEQRLTRSSFLFGNGPSLADVALFPFVRQFAAVDRAAFDALALPHLQRWLKHWLNHDYFAAIIFKHQPWQADDSPVFLITPINESAAMT